MCVKDNLQIISKQDGLPLSVLWCQPDEEGGKTCRGIVQIVHGMSEYKERYLPLLEYLAEQGFASVIHDHRGHGESVRDTADYGYMYEVGTDGFLKDILQVNTYARTKMSGLPIILLGHSMGSLAVRSLMRQQDTCMDALILSGAPCKNNAVDLAIGLAALQKKIWGGRHKAKLLETMSFMTYVKRFAGEKSKFAWVCSDPAVVEAYDQDPKCGFTFTVDGFQVLFDLMKRTYTLTDWNCRRPNMQVLFMAGTNDPCIESREKFEEEMDYMRKAGYEHVKGILYDGMRHEICNEPEKKHVFEDIGKFLQDSGF